MKAYVKTIFQAVCTFALSVSTYAGEISHSSIANDGFPKIQLMHLAISGLGEYPLDPHSAGPIFIDVPTSPKFGKTLQLQFKALGFSLANTEKEAQTTIHFTCGYEFHRPGEAPTRVDLSEALEHTGGVTFVSSADPSIKTIDDSHQPLAQGLRGSLSTNTVFDGTLSSALESMNAHSVNRIDQATDGSKCGNESGGCSAHGAYKQELRVRMFIEGQTGKTVVRANAKADAEQLLPEPLFHAAMLEMASRLNLAGISNQKQMERP